MSRYLTNLDDFTHNLKQGRWGGGGIGGGMNGGKE